MSGFIASLAWRGDYPVVQLYGKEQVNLDQLSARAVLARMGDNCSDDGCLLTRVGRNFIADDVRLSVERVKKIQAAWVKIGVLKPLEDEGGRGQYAFYEIDVERLAEFIPQKRLPKAWRRADGAVADENSPQENRVAHDPVLKPGRCEAETGSPEGKTGSPQGSKPGRNYDPHKNKPLEQSLDVERARGDAAPDGASPPGAEGPGREGGQSRIRGESAAGASPASDEARPQGAQDGERAARSISESERERFWRQRFIIDWLKGETPAFLVIRKLGLEGVNLSADTIEEIALSQRPTYLKAVAGFVRWAEACNAGDASQRPPIPTVRELMESLADPAKRTLMARQLALLLRRDAEICAGPDGEDEDGEMRAGEAA